jgi:hypothetical protein
MPEKINFKIRKIYFGSQFQSLQFMVAWPYSFGPVEGSKSIMVGNVWESKAAHLWHLGSKDSRRSWEPGIPVRTHPQ